MILSSHPCDSTGNFILIAAGKSSNAQGASGDGHLCVRWVTQNLCWGQWWLKVLGTDTVVLEECGASSSYGLPL